MKMTYGVGILGLGVQGQTVASAFARSPRFRLVAAFDPVGEVALEVARAPHADGVVANPAVDCVYIASPPGRHREGVTLAAAAGKGVLCEKPLAPTPEIAAAMVETVRTAGIAAAVNFGFATDRVGRSVAAAVHSEVLGPVTHVRLELRFPAWPRGWQSHAGTWLVTPTEGGFVREVSSHFVYFVDRLLGPGAVSRSTVERREDGLERSIEATVMHGEVPFDISGSIGDSTADVYRLVIECARGTITIDDWGTVRGVPLDVPGESPVAAFAALLDGAATDLPDFDAGARVVAVVERLLAS